MCFCDRSDVTWACNCNREHSPKSLSLDKFLPVNCVYRYIAYPNLQLAKWMLNQNFLLYGLFQSFGSTDLFMYNFYLGLTKQNQHFVNQTTSTRVKSKVTVQPKMEITMIYSHSCCSKPITQIKILLMKPEWFVPIYPQITHLKVLVNWTNFCFIN